MSTHSSFGRLRNWTQTLDPALIPEEKVCEVYDRFKQVIEDARQFYQYDRSQIERQWDRIQFGTDEDGYPVTDPVPKDSGTLYRLATVKKHALAVKAGWCEPGSYGDPKLQRIIDSVT